METPIPVEPKVADHYLNLDLPQHATTGGVKKAYRALVLVHHPDKKAPGQTEDAAEFRKVIFVIAHTERTEALINHRYKRHTKLYQIQ